MRTIKTAEITEAVAKLCKEAAYYLPDDVYEALKKGRETEKSPVGKDVLEQIIKNAEIAKAEDRPYCQDTGLTIVFVEIGQDVHIEGGLLEDAINEGIGKGYTEGYLRKSVVAEPLFNRKNTGNNTPGVIYTQLGGTTTTLAVHVEWYPTHIAGLPVAVTICCHAARHAECVL